MFLPVSLPKQDQPFQLATASSELTEELERHRRKSESGHKQDDRAEAFISGDARSDLIA